jgi:hypothetical protein
MEQLTGVFWFFEAEDLQWRISLPFCPVCEPQLAENVLGPTVQQKPFSREIARLSALFETRRKPTTFSATQNDGMTTTLIWRGAERIRVRNLSH